MGINFDILFPEIRIPPDQTYCCTAELHVERHELMTVLEEFEKQGIPWSDGKAATEGRVLREPAERKFFCIDCWIDQDRNRDITYETKNDMSMVECNTPQFYLDDVLFRDDEPEIHPLDLATLYS